MKKVTKTRHDPDMLDEYDFSKGIRGKYIERLKAGSNIAASTAIIATTTKSSINVNAERLRSLIVIRDSLFGKVSETWLLPNNG